MSAVEPSSTLAVVPTLAAEPVEPTSTSSPSALQSPPAGVKTPRSLAGGSFNVPPAAPAAKNGGGGFPEVQLPMPPPTLLQLDPSEPAEPGVAAALARKQQYVAFLDQTVGNAAQLLAAHAEAEKAALRLEAAQRKLQFAGKLDLELAAQTASLEQQKLAQLLALHQKAGYQRSCAAGRSAELALEHARASAECSLGEMAQAQSREQDRLKGELERGLQQQNENEQLSNNLFLLSLPSVERKVLAPIMSAQRAPLPTMCSSVRAQDLSASLSPKNNLKQAPAFAPVNQVQEVVVSLCREEEEK